MIIHKDDYEFDGEVKNEGGSYNEYLLNEEYLWIQKETCFSSYMHRRIRSKLIKQNHIAYMVRHR